MLKGISPLISPELLKILCEMGHGDEIVLADANFPSETTGKRVIRADGIGAADLLKAILPLFPLDTYEKDRFILMEVVSGDPVVPTIWDDYKQILEEKEPGTPVTFMESILRGCNWRNGSVCEYNLEKGCCVYGIIKNGMEDYYNHKSYKASTTTSDNH